MKRTFTATLITIAFALFPLTVITQEEARAAWQVTNFEITSTVQHAERLLNAVTIISATNIGRGTGNTFTFRINSKANIKTVSAGGQTATFRAVPEAAGNLQRVTITLPSPVAPGLNLNTSISYSLPVEGNTGLSAISPVGSQFLPLSFWYPTPNTAFTLRGADTAPYRLTVNGTNVISAGTDKAAAGGTMFEQTLNAQPFFLTGDWDRVDGTGDARNITAFAPRGANADEKKQAEALIALTANARSFYAGLLGPAPDVPVRLVAVRRGSGFNEAGTILLEQGSFRRAKTDATTALLIAESIARLWVGGQTAVRGEGGGVVREGLTRYLATLFLEKQFGREALREELLRERLAYSTVAKKDGPLGRVTPADATYFSAVPNKGAMVWRMLDASFGRDAFIGTLRTALQTGKGPLTGIGLAGLRAAFAEKGGEPVKILLDHLLDEVTDIDLLVGLPQSRGNESVAAVRNLGSVDVVTTAKGTTASGEQLLVPVTVGARNFAEAVFKTPAKIVRVEIDPDKIYPQLDYSNDSAPRLVDLQVALADASRFFGAQDYAKAEATARQVLAAAPEMQEARIVLARALLGQNRIDEAEKLFTSIVNSTLPIPAAFAWANVGLGEIALKKNQSAEAARRFNEAVRADAEYAASLAARAGRIKAETAANSIAVDSSVKAFITQLDQAITSGKKAELESRVLSGELVRFIGGVVGTQPEIWRTQVLRTEQLDANLIAADVSLDTKELGNQQSGTAVLILARVDGNWKLAGIDLFEVR